MAGEESISWRELGLTDGTSPGKTVCIQGLGFVGSAMAAAVLRGAGADGAPYTVIGVDLPLEEGARRAAALAAGRFPFGASDPEIERALREGKEAGRLFATTDPRAYSLADVVIMDVDLDVAADASPPRVNFSHLKAAATTLGRHLGPGGLIIVETTVPPGATEHLIGPAVDEALEARGLPPGAIRIAHSFERVMPGPDYLSSIVNFWRCFAGRDPESADLCRAFLQSVVNTADYPLTELKSTTASEIAKLMENSYRAVTIAYVEEWAQLAERIGVDLFEVVDAIRKRPTHSNMRQPGLGVGGYCLTKDPLLAGVGVRDILNLPDLDFPFCNLAIRVNRQMPLATVALIERRFGADISGRRVLVMGATYRSDLSDTRHSPSATLIRALEAAGAEVVCHDPHIEWFGELDRPVEKEMPGPQGLDIVVWAVPHAVFRRMDLAGWLGEARPAMIDANDVLTAEQRAYLTGAGIDLISRGRG